MTFNSVPRLTTPKQLKSDGTLGDLIRTDGQWEKIYSATGNQDWESFNLEPTLSKYSSFRLTMLATYDAHTCYWKMKSLGTWKKTGVMFQDGSFGAHDIHSTAGAWYGFGNQSNVVLEAHYVSTNMYWGQIIGLERGHGALFARTSIDIRNFHVGVDQSGNSSWSFMMEVIR